jgi:hypothetical protein
MYIISYSLISESPIKYDSYVDFIELADHKFYMNYHTPDKVSMHILKFSFNHFMLGIL